LKLRSVREKKRHVKRRRMRRKLERKSIKLN